MTLSEAINNLAPHMARLCASPTTHDPAMEQAWIDLLQAIGGETADLHRERALILQRKRMVVV